MVHRVAQAAQPRGEVLGLGAESAADVRVDLGDHAVEGVQLTVGVRARLGQRCGIVRPARGHADDRQVPLPLQPVHQVVGGVLQAHLLVGSLVGGRFREAVPDVQSTEHHGADQRDEQDRQQLGAQSPIAQPPGALGTAAGAGAKATTPPLGAERLVSVAERLAHVVDTGVRLLRAAQALATCVSSGHSRLPLPTTAEARTAHENLHFHRTVDRTRSSASISTATRTDRLSMCRLPAVARSKRTTGYWRRPRTGKWVRPRKVTYRPPVSLQRGVWIFGHIRSLCVAWNCRARGIRADYHPFRL